MPTAPTTRNRHFLGAPLVDSKGSPFGVMSLIKNGEEPAFQPPEVELFSIIAAQVSLAIERKRAEELLAGERTLLLTVIDTIPDRFFVKDRQNRYLLNNAAHIRLLGARNQGEVIGKTDYDFRPAEYAEIYCSNDEKVMADDTALFNFEEPSFLPSGEVGTMLVSTVPLHDEAGRVTGLVGISRDITARKRMEEELRSSNENLRKMIQEGRRNEQAAQRVQEALLPTPESSDYLEVSTIFEPFGFVGGDLYYLSWRYGGNLLRGFMVDATGHGLATALHTASLHSLLREVNERDLPLADTLRWLNRRVGEYFAEGIFAGALGFEIDLETRQLRWVCAGIPNVWMATQTITGNVKCPGMCLGISEEEQFDVHTMTIEVGDAFYIMTDGLTDLLEGKTDLPLSQYPEMVAMLRTLSKTESRRDDATALCIRIYALPSSPVRQDGWPRILRFNGYGDYQRLKGEIAAILTEVTGKPHSLQEVAVHEALANAMECRDGVPRQHKARLRFNKLGNRLIVRVRTSRMGFAGNAVLRRLRSHPEEMFSFVEDASMGRGIPMMLSMSHKMTYNSEGTEVLLAWKL